MHVAHGPSEQASRRLASKAGDLEDRLPVLEGLTGKVASPPNRDAYHRKM
jgi:hypothetical protein